MRILLVSSFLLFPETRFGGSKRILNIAASLEPDHDLSIVCFDGCGEAARWDGTAGFRKFLALPDTGPDRKRPRHAHHLDMGDAVRRHRKALDAFLLAGGRFDRVILAYALAPNLLAVPAAAGGRIVYIEGDLALVQSDRARKQAPDPLRRLLKEIRYAQVRRYYARFLARTDAFFLSTVTEMREVEARFPGTVTVQLPMGLETGAMAPQPAPRESGVAGFLGNFKHPPNLDAVLWYLDHVHPRLKALHPQYRFLIAGMDLPESLRARVEGDSSVIAAGAVPDLEAYYARISFTVNPIVSGKGIRTKVVEAAAYGRAVVSTTLGADGTEPLELDRGDTPEAFAACCSRLIRDGNGSGSEARSARNRAIVEESFSSDAVKRKLLGGVIRRWP